MKLFTTFLLACIGLMFLFLAPVACASTGTAIQGKSLTLYLVSCDGTQPFTFQWQKNGTAIAGATGTALPSGITGVAGSAYTIPVIAATDAGVYTCVVTNNAGSATSDTATITVEVAPSGAVTGVKVTQNGVTTSYPIT